MTVLVVPDRRRLARRRHHSSYAGLGAGIGAGVGALPGIAAGRRIVQGIDAFQRDFKGANFRQDFKDYGRVFSFLKHFEPVMQEPSLKTKAKRLARAVKHSPTPPDLHPFLARLAPKLEALKAMSKKTKGRLQMGAYLAGGTLGGLAGYLAGKRIKKRSR